MLPSFVVFALVGAAGATRRDRIALHLRAGARIQQRPAASNEHQRNVDAGGSAFSTIIIVVTIIFVLVIVFVIVVFIIIVIFSVAC
jgi:hypothetical protein